MVEVIAIFGCFGLLLLVFFEWVSTLPCFYTVITALAAIPVLSLCDYFYLRQKWNLRGIHAKREPIPPERFYWIFQRPRLKRIILVCALFSFVIGAVAVFFPAPIDISLSAVLGWTNVLLGIAAGSRAISGTVLFFRASQWFDIMSPMIVGSFRKAMYQLSDNYEYLGNRHRDAEKENVY
jgi:hypothetical protein